MNTGSIGRRIAPILFLQIVVVCSPARGQDAASVVVTGFVDAYNSHDVALMQDFVTNDVRWMSVSANKVSVETTGKAELSESMTSFFEGIPSTQAILHSIRSLGNYVSLIEESRWESNGEMHSQCAVSVYELQEGLIANVWYFAAQPCTDTSDD